MPIKIRRNSARIRELCWTMTAAGPPADAAGGRKLKKDSSGESCKRHQIHPMHHLNNHIRRWEEHAIDDVRYSIACRVVCTNDLLELFAVGSNIDSFPRPEHVHILALNCGDTLEVLQIRGQNLSWEHVVSEDVDKLVLVLGLQQTVQCSLWECTKRFVCWSKDGEWTWRAECFSKISCNNCCNQCGEIIHRLSQFNDVGFGISKPRRWEEYTINNVCNTIARQVV